MAGAGWGISDVFLNHGIVTSILLARDQDDPGWNVSTYLILT